MPATVISREEVLHVARLARLALSEEELEPMARELSAVLDHIAKIGELDVLVSQLNDEKERDEYVQALRNVIGILSENFVRRIVR